MLLTQEEYEELLKRTYEADKLELQVFELKKELCFLAQERDELRATMANCPQDETVANVTQDDKPSLTFTSGGTIVGGCISNGSWQDVRATTTEESSDAQVRKLQEELALAVDNMVQDGRTIDALRVRNRSLEREKDELEAEIELLNARIVRLEAELTILAASRDVWQDLSKKYKRILKGGS